ncbi:MAG: two-component system, OmpR family, response regulator ArlR [Thermoanaerobacterium sp.]|jgi:DNA-binding response OmpR family regulator|uniref:response regulator transcription factor n=1 Tax=Thermoanaerobacterium thermosaccharolyticum TaxID=1517 RepID=UPI0024AAF560|nr:two-component system, OmpR family, response regulator ArlR [Thermoanaerobacterium sp.]MDK2805346.1 two-component system, OmpR family, response regulator ArlR [Thermoanaerobacterium sp.]MDN5315880.1 two-component system, OmpR family, response regulator ArlR [Thermoanaerobacterium sp.]WHE08349.1 response regulator transcription factor [Thermoanaerobacterium thermosaccharolyticum]
MVENILIIEDEKKIARFLQMELEHEGYNVVIEYSGDKGLRRALDGNYDLIILDLMLPGMDGFSVLKEIRKKSSIPVIILSAKDEIKDKVMGLDIGADDYLTKPFSIEELMARIRNALRKNIKANTKKISYDGITMDLSTYEVKRDGVKIELTKKEFDLLKYLIINSEIVLTRENILENVWGYNYIGETNIVDVYIRYLRSKIDEPFSDKLIQTVRGVGYSLRKEKNEN